jgi:hypothetical protein
MSWNAETYAIRTFHDENKCSGLDHEWGKSSNPNTVNSLQNYRVNPPIQTLLTAYKTTGLRQQPSNMQRVQPHGRSHSVQRITKVRLHMDFLVKIQGASNAKPLYSVIFRYKLYFHRCSTHERRNKLRNN